MNMHDFLRKHARPALALGMAACLVGGVAGEVPEAVGVFGVGRVSAQALTAEETSLQPIVGIWQESGVPDARKLTIYADGAYELVRSDVKAYGKVRVTAEEHPDGSKSLWYSFYEIGGVTLEDKDTDPWYAAFTSANELWAAFPKEDVETQTELVAGQDGAMRFLRNPEEVYQASRGDVQAKDYLGVWGCGRCTAVVSREDAGYHVELHWGSSAAEGSRWIYQCSYDNDSGILFSNGNGTRVDYVYTSEEECTDTMIYNDGAAVFVLRDGRMTWKDRKENAGEDMEFVRDS